jgi:phosphatidylglycerophosphate synthase
MWVLGFRICASTGKNGLNFLYNPNFSLIFRDRVSCDCRDDQTHPASALVVSTINRSISILSMLKAYIPSILVGFRLAVAPLLLLDAIDLAVSKWFLVGYIIAVLSDIFDGIIARRLGVSTVRLRQADSCADICLYLCVAASAWLIYPQIIIDLKVPLFLAATAQISLYAMSWLKFRKSPSFHTYTAKIWGLTLLVATVRLFGFDDPNFLWLAIGMCIINSSEEIAMTLILPEWQCDVLSIFAAIDLRNSSVLILPTQEKINTTNS